MDQFLAPCLPADSSMDQLRLDKVEKEAQEVSAELCKTFEDWNAKPDNIALKQRYQDLVAKETRLDELRWRSRKELAMQKTALLQQGAILQPCTLKLAGSYNQSAL